MAVPAALIAMIQPRRIIAIGRDAGLALSDRYSGPYSSSSQLWRSGRIHRGNIRYLWYLDERGHRRMPNYPLRRHAASGGAPA